MAGLKNADDYAAGEKFSAGGLKYLLLMVGAGAGLLFFIIAAAQPEVREIEGTHAEYSPRGGMAYSWLFAVMFFMTLTIGGIFWTLVHNATNSGWGTVVRRLFENLGSVFVVLMLVAAPLVFVGDFRENLWEWIPKERELSSWEPTPDDVSNHQKHIREEIDSAKAVLEAEKTKVTAGTTAGEKRHFEDTIAALTKQLAYEESRLVSDEEAAAALKAEHFKHGDLILYKKSSYLNLGSWQGRYFLYIIGLAGVIFTLRFWSVKGDETGDPKYFRWMRRAACGFLPIFAASWTFLVIDWLMALDYTWFSTMWGVYLFAGSAQSSMAFLIILLTLLRRAGYLKDVVSMEHYHLMGKLLLSFTVFWAYIAFSQYFLIWYANITEETKFYLTRNTAFWNTYSIAFLVIGHFILPFGALLMQQWKKNPVIICGICGWILLMHAFDIYWIIIPERGPTLTGGAEMMVPGIFYDVLAWVAVGCLFGFALLWILGRGSLFPCRDPRLDESLNVTN